MGARHDDVLHDGCGEQTEEDLAACMVVGRVLGELVPRKSFGCVERLTYSKVVGKEEEVVDMGEGKGVGREVVGVEDSMVVLP